MDAVFDDRRYLIPFRTALLPQIFTDCLVIGCGVAGMRAALEAADHGDVIVTAKGGKNDSNTYQAQGGIAAVLDESDTPAQHIQDTLLAGGDLCDQPVVSQVVNQGPDRVRELIDWGIHFDRDDSNDGHIRDDNVNKNNSVAGDNQQKKSPLMFGLEGGHSHARILHSDGDATGKEMALTLNKQVHDHDNIRLFENCFVLDLITTDGQADAKCIGAITHHDKYGLQVIWAQSTILASGGCGQVFRESTNPSVATGDGLAMAYRAGAKLADMAFVQFHPTTLYIAGASRALITEAVRGEGAKLIDKNGYRFMADYDDRLELAPRDVVAQAILQQIAKTGSSHVFLDARHMGTKGFSARFPGITKLLQKFDIDPGKKPIPVHPSAHYMIGGVQTDQCGRTSVPGLYACGEAASSGLHGANRLASNSLLEGLVYGKIAGFECGKAIENGNRTPEKIISFITPSDRSELDLSDVRSSLRSVMWRHVGIERDGQRLEEVTEMFEFWARYSLDKIVDDRAGWEVQNLLTVGALITQAARWRKETRGTHYRIDFPESKKEFHLHDIWQRGSSAPQTEPVKSMEMAQAHY